MPIFVSIIEGTMIESYYLLMRRFANILCRTDLLVRPSP